ncbi:MAG: hypothetical protein HBSIN02_25210 [Bacteroidia bacterium]|nr:MAG: hypothetical protein HBSIN02_25210 [Bacteroidia bacterium]
MSISPGAIPNNTGYEVWVNLGGSSFLIRKDGTGYCLDTTAHEMNPFPITLPGCGAIGMSARTFVPAPWVWSCAVREAGLQTPQVSGNTAIFVANGTLWYTSFTATLTVTASLDESYQVAQVIAEPESNSLACNSATVVDVTILDGFGNLFAGCSNAPIMGTATIQAKGLYAYLEGNGQAGQTIEFTLSGGQGSFLAVLDTSRGIISGGSDAAIVTVTVNGVQGSTDLLLSCQYPPPSITITNPMSDTTIYLSATNQPTIMLGEEHAPKEGQFIPSISWEPSPTINTAEYFDQIQDSLVIPVRVIAESDGGVAADSVSITLKKNACEEAPQCAVPGAPIAPSFRVVPRENGFNGTYLADCISNPHAQGGFLPVQEGTTLSTEPYNISTCFDAQNGKWRFRIFEPIQVNAILDICENRIPVHSRVYDINEIEPYDRCSVARRDLENRRAYNATYEKYVFIQVLLMHEQMHLLDFQNLMLEMVPVLIQRMNAIQSKPCDAFHSVEIAQREGERLIKQALDYFFFLAGANWNENSRPEEEIHNLPAVQLLITDLMTQLCPH